MAGASEATAPTVVASEITPAAPALEPILRRPTTARRTLGWVAVAVICIAAIGLGIAFPHQIAHQIALSVTRQPQPFTELYFSNAKSLPKSLSFSRPNVFGFTVVNHQGRKFDYSYDVTLTSSYGSSTIARGRIPLANRRGATEVVHVNPTHGATKYLIAVHLVGRNERIWFRAVSQ